MGIILKGYMAVHSFTYPEISNRNSERLSSTSMHLLAPVKMQHVKLLRGIGQLTRVAAVSARGSTSRL
jgi:hypothetical protein